MIQISKTQNTIFISGNLTTDAVKTAWDWFGKKESAIKLSRIYLDLSGVSAIDSAGVAFLDEIQSSFQGQITLVNIPEQIKKTIAAFSTDKIAQCEPATTRRFIFEIIGDKAFRLASNLLDLLYLTADIFYWGIVGLFQRKGQRKGSFIQQSILIGVNALKIVALISFLIGFILALQSAAQLRQFGANIYIADLIGIAMLQEMGPIMTAIVVAGRSGSAIASEISTMVVTEEIDALKSMALNPIRFVIVPKTHAITITLPLLTIFSNLIGIFGGFIIGITYLQLSPAAFINELLTVLMVKDLFTGLIKSVVFAWIIVIVSCYQGLKVTGGAEGVGKATTASVVASIFFVIVADSILGLIFYFG